MEKVTLVLEGGAMRGVFTSGVLDCLMDQGIEFDHVIGVSAGACNGISYVSKQNRRMHDSMVHVQDLNGFYEKPLDAIRKRELMKMDVLFDDYPNRDYPFDYDTFFKSPIHFEMVVTNCETGKAEYMVEKENRSRLMDICKASSSMPLVSKIVNIDGAPYLDGGLADSLPIQRAKELPNEKIVMILTRQRGYRKKYYGSNQKVLFSASYKAYPKLIRTLMERPLRYNRTLAYIEELEDRGEIVVIRPSKSQVKRLEKDVEKLEDIYAHGYATMIKSFDALMQYIKPQEEA